jgi:hypothetical protein
VFIRDIDELKNAGSMNGMGSLNLAKEIEEDHNNQHKLVQACIRSTMVVEPGPRGEFIYAGRGEGPLARTLTEFTPGELAGQSLDALYGDATPHGVRKLLSDALKEHEPLSCDILSYTKSKQPWWRHMLVIPIPDDCFLMFNVNVTRLKRYVGPYTIGVSVGRGSFGTVRVAKHKDTGKIVALKKVDATDARIQKLVDLEIKIQTALVAPCVVQLIDVMKAGSSVFMAMEFARGGSIFESVVGAGGITESRAAALFTQIVTSVQFCHSKSVRGLARICLKSFHS